jgi:alkanesulfonate monooxygenase SsuD/methylene tetrahydromethanopterin reductase-like flavin-dependent oxidoreductase (luciferase family)
MVPSINELEMEAFSVINAIFMPANSRGLPLHELYETELDHVRALEEIGIKRVFFAEDHNDPDRPSPSQPVIIGAASQRTSRIRLGALVYVQPLRSPLLIAEEVSMLDHICKGRLDLGLGSGGVSTLECLKLDPNIAREMSNEATMFLLEYFRSGGSTFSFNGRYYRFENVRPPIMPYQRPHPPIWLVVKRRGPVEWAAENGFNIVSPSLSWLKGTVKEHFDLYKRIFESRASSPVGDKGPFLSLYRPILLDKEGHRAKQRGEAAIRRRITYLIKELGSSPYGDLYVDNSLLSELRNVIERGSATDYAVQRGIAFIGTPDQVAAQMKRAITETGANSFVLLTRFGDLSHTESLKTVELLVNEVAPALIKS